MVIKKDGRRERFERQKILQGLLKACEKRPVATPKLEAIVDEIEGVVQESTERELTTTEIGEMIMHRLKKLDKVAYVRFASVYMDFKDVQEFMRDRKSTRLNSSHQIISYAVFCLKKKKSKSKLVKTFTAFSHNHLKRILLIYSKSHLT